MARGDILRGENIRGSKVDFQRDPQAFREKTIGGKTFQRGGFDLSGGFTPSFRIRFEPDLKALQLAVGGQKKEFTIRARAATKEVGRYMRDRIRERIDTSSPVHGGAFKWFAPSTRRRRPWRETGRVLAPGGSRTSKSGNVGKLNEGGTGAMRNSIVWRDREMGGFDSDGLPKGHQALVTVNNTGDSINSPNRAKVAAHSEGLQGLGKQGQTNLPRRQFFGFAKVDMWRIQKLFEKHVLEDSIKNGFVKFIVR